MTELWIRALYGGMAGKVFIIPLFTWEGQPWKCESWKARENGERSTQQRLNYLSISSSSRFSGAVVLVIANFAKEIVLPISRRDLPVKVLIELSRGKGAKKVKKNKMSARKCLRSRGGSSPNQWKNKLSLFHTSKFVRSKKKGLN